MLAQLIAGLRIVHQLPCQGDMGLQGPGLRPNPASPRAASRDS